MVTVSHSQQSSQSTETTREAGETSLARLQTASADARAVSLTVPQALPLRCYLHPANEIEWAHNRLQNVSLTGVGIGRELDRLLQLGTLQVAVLQQAMRVYRIRGSTSSLKRG